MNDLKYNEYIENALDEADREAEELNTRYYTHEEMKKMAKQIIDGKRYLTHEEVFGNIRRKLNDKKI